jgi:MFS family permease
MGQGGLSSPTNGLNSAREGKFPMQEAAYRKYLLYVLLLILAFNQLDRLALGVVMQDIKLELHLTDTQLGALTGIAFAFFYAVMGIPIARWADRGNRVTILAVTALLWSVAVALCGAARNFFDLMVLRMTVAVGESGCMPTAHSLIADEYSREERPRAVALYMLGVPLALTTGYFAAGWLNEFYGWRTTFVVLGLPGLALAAVAQFTLREPRRLKGTARTSTTEVAVPIRDVLALLWKSRAFRHLLFSFSVWFFFAYGILQWLPAFFIRSHGLNTGELGTWFALVWGVGGGIGMYLGGEVAARYAAGQEGRQLKGCALAFAFFPPLAVTAFLVPNAYAAFGALAVGCLVGNMAQAPMLSTAQAMVPQRMRAMSIALVYLFANLIGMGLGPLAAGVLSDVLRPQFGEESLRYALVILCPGYFWASWHLWRAGQTVKDDVRRMDTAPVEEGQIEMRRAVARPLAD